MKYSKFMLGLLLFLGPYFGYTQVCETPNNDQAMLFQPCTWDIGNDAGPLSRVANSQHYAYTEITDAAATVNSFCATSGTGFLQIGSHASPFSLLIEAYSPDSAGIVACTTSYNNLIAAGFARNEITLVRGRRLAGIAITDDGIRNRWADNNSIVFVGACYSFWLAPDFDSKEYFGYWWPTSGIEVGHDATLLFSRMDGTIDFGNSRPAGDAFAGGGFTRDFDHRSTAGGRTTLAPRVIDVYPHDEELPPGIHPGYVEFDTKMKPNPPADVLTMTVYGEHCTAHLIDQIWANEHRLEFKIDNSACSHPDEMAGLGFTVHNGLAVSSNNERELDGGYVAYWGFESGIGPNRDDFIFKNMCTGGKKFTVARGLSLAPTTPISGMQDDSVDIIEDTIVVAGLPASSQYSIFTIKNASWMYLDTVTFVATDLIGESGVIPKDSVSFDPDTIYELPPDTIGRLILLGVDIPTGQPQGDYIGKITVDGYGTDSLTLMVKVDQPPVITVSDTFVSVSIGDTAKLVVNATDPEADSIDLYAEMYPFTAWLEETDGDSLVFYFSPDSADTGLTLGVVFYADDGVLKVGKPVIIEVLRVGVEEDGMLLPKNFFLGQNYPNPFFQTTKIEYWIPYSAEVKMTVYNLAGQKVATLVDGKKGPGSYTTSWDGRDDRGRALPRGIYFYRLETAEFRATRKLILLR